MPQACRPTTGLQSTSHQGFEARSMKVTGPGGIGSSSGARAVARAPAAMASASSAPGRGRRRQPGAPRCRRPRRHGRRRPDRPAGRRRAAGAQAPGRAAAPGASSTCWARSSSACWKASSPAGDLDRLRRAVRDERDATEDPGLEAVLDEIELRAAVEMAKLGAVGPCGLTARDSVAWIETAVPFAISPPRVSGCIRGLGVSMKAAAVLADRPALPSFGGRSVHE